jgi:hypothetical protein
MRKVWTYLSSEPLTEQQEAQLQAAGKEFVNGWTAHENPLKADFQIFRHRILVVTVDEEVHNASGCSIDKLLRFIKDTEKKLNIQLLNRLLVAVEAGGKIQVHSAAEIPELLKKGILTAESGIYNTAVADEGQLAGWLQPLRNTWLSKHLH